MNRAFLIGPLIAFAAAHASAQTVSFVNVNVVRPGQGDVLPSQTVVVTDGRVREVGPTASRSTLAPGVTVDGRGRYLVPGIAVLDARLPSENWLDWREALLVYLAHGVTTLGVSEAELEALARARTEGEDVWPRPRLSDGGSVTAPEAAAASLQVASHPSGLSLPSLEGDPPSVLRRHLLDLSSAPVRVAEIEPGSLADLLLLAEDPLRDATALGRPLGVMVEGRWTPRTELEALARTFAEMRRAWYPARRPRKTEGPWPASCVGVSLDDCFGGDPECGVLGRTASVLVACNAASERADRQAVVHALGLLVLVNPTDEWIVGQRVHFALMSGDLEHAWEAAETCAATTWWCQTLRGLVLHERDPASARVRFDSAYANAPETTPAWSSPRIPEAGDRGLHCESSDIGYLIADPDLLTSYRAEGCGNNKAFEERFWWLADPLWSREGNERSDAHIARNVQMRIRDDYLRLWGQNHAHCISSRRDIRDTVSGDCLHGHRVIILFGLPNSWRGVPYTLVQLGRAIQVDATGGGVGPPGSGVIVPRGVRTAAELPRRYHPQLRVGFLNGGYSFVPDAGRFLDPMASRASDWAVTWNEGHERMLTRETWYNLEHQTAVLRRGAELQVLAVARFPILLPSLDGIEGYLAAGRISDQHVEVVPGGVDRQTGFIRASATLPDDEWLTSIEALGPELRGRARHGAPAPRLIDGYGISTPVLVRPDFDPERGSLLQAMLPSAAAAHDQRVGIYFELYGVEAGQPVDVTLVHEALGTGRPSLLGRLASAVGIGRGSGENIQLQWSEPIAEVSAGAAHGFVALDLRSLAPGEHRITLTASTRGRTASSSTEILIRR